MGYWLFNGTTSKAVSSATPAVSAAPLTMIVCASAPSPSTAAASAMSIGNNGATTSVAINVSSGSTNIMSAASRVTGSNTPATVAFGTRALRFTDAFEVTIARYADGGTPRRIWSGSLANFGIGTGASNPTGLNRLGVGFRIESSDANFWANKIYYAGVCLRPPSIDEVERLLSFEHPLDVIPHKLVHFYEARAEGFHDVVGGLDLTATSVTFVQSGFLIPRRRRDFTAPLFGRKARFRRSVGDVNYEVISPTWGADQFPPIEARSDQANNVIGLRVNAGTEVTTATTGTHNAPTGDRILGARLVDGAAQNDTGVGIFGQLDVVSGIPAGDSLKVVRARSRDWATPVLDATISPTVDPAGGNVSLAAGVQDPAGFGWQITSARRVGGTATATVAIGADLHSVDLSSVTGSFGDTVLVEAQIQNLLATDYRTTATATFTIALATTVYTNGYAARHRVRLFNNTGTALANFPAWFRSVDYPDLQDTLASLANGGYVTDAAGHDIRFETLAGVALKYERVTWAADGTFEVWFKEPSAGNGATDCWCYAGKSGAADEQDVSTSGVWSDYALVLNCRTGADRSGHGRDLSPTSIGTGTLVGDAADFDGVNSILQASGAGGTITGPTALGSPVSSTTPANSITTGTISPSANSLLLVRVGSRDATTHTHTAPTVTSLTNVGSWTQIEQDTQADTGGAKITQSWWWAKVTGSAGSGTITGHLSISCDDQEIEVYECSAGYDATTPIRQSVKALNNTGTTISATYASAPLSNSVVMSGVFQNSSVSDITGTGGWTELTDGRTGGVICWQTQYDTSNTATAVSNSGLPNNKARVLIAFEVAAASGTDPLTWFGGAGWGDVTWQYALLPDSDAPGTNRGHVIQGDRGAAVALAGLTSYWTSESPLDSTVLKPLIASVVRSGGRAYAISDGSDQGTIAQAIHAVCPDGQVPRLYRAGVRLATSAAVAASGNVTKQAGGLYVGDGPSSAALPRAGPWKGLEDEFRIRLGLLTDQWCALEQQNWFTPHLTVAVGARDLPSDADAGPVAKPVSVDCTTGTEASIDVLTGAFSPSGRALSIASAGAPASGTVRIIGTGASAKVGYTASASTTNDWQVTISDGIKSCPCWVRAVSTSAAVATLPRIGAGNTNVSSLYDSIGVDGTGAGQWNVKLTSATLFNGAASVANWTAYAAKTSGDWWNTGNATLTNLKSRGILPILSLPIIGTADVSYAALLAGAYDTALDTVLGGIATKMGTSLWVARIGWEPNNNVESWYVLRFGSTAAHIDAYKNGFRYIANWIRVNIGDSSKVLIDWCPQKYNFGSGAGASGGHVIGSSSWRLEDIWPNRATGADSSVGLNDATGLLYPTKDLVDVCAYDHYDASPYAGQASSTGSTFAKWSGDLATSGSSDSGPMRALAFAQARGKPMAIDETGLRPLARSGGCDNADYVTYWHTFLTTKVTRTTCRWWNWFNMDVDDDDTGHAHEIYPNTPYQGSAAGGGGTLVGQGSSLATALASAEYEAQFNRTNYSQ